ncbi:putative crack-3 bf [Operophtera brumata]|uniref:Putative crack-3 bf n=1 Tax=Operophtera brumata TaxID=104452 RepID=A0A0L7LMF7_OPEBR|nr:putative crack-3 bf [Operophtera brumata]
MEIVLDELKCSHVETSVICLSEHFVIKGEEHYLKLNNFSLKAIYARHDKRRGGACILTRNDIECVELDTIKDLATKNHFEICGIEIKHLKTIIICFYRIPNSDINIFFEKLQITLERLLFKGCKLVIAGDFNIDIFVKNKISILVMVATSDKEDMADTDKMVMADEDLVKAVMADKDSVKAVMADKDTGKAVMAAKEDSVKAVMADKDHTEAVFKVVLDDKL